MNQTTIGSYITNKRREKNLTQEQLAEKLGVSNKTISKWENGKCMPDYSIIEQLCEELSVTLSELMDGEDATEDSMRVYDDEQILDLLRRMQELERQKNILYGIILIVLGIACNAMAGTVSGSEVQEFISGLLTGLSVAEILAGIVVVGKSVLKRKPQKDTSPACNLSKAMCLSFYSSVSASPKSRVGVVFVMVRSSSILTL